jgi:hypothetical protein
MVEQYKIIKDFPNYSVSNFGNIRNDKTGRVLKQQIDTQGYYKVSLYSDGNSYKKYVHHLVGTMFIPNPENKKCIGHINNNRLNNNIENLRMVSYNENCMNRKLSSKNSSNYKGVTYDKQRNKWLAHIAINGKSKTLGRFDKIEDAVNCRVKKAKEIFGDYINSCEKEVTINLNIPATTKVNLNINIKPKEDQELEELEKEFNDILKAK